MTFFPELRFRILMDLAKYAIFAFDGAPFRLRVFGRETGLGRAHIPVATGNAVSIPSAGRVLSGWQVEPQGKALASLLILHGIGDHLRYWRAAQLHLAQHRIGSLVFHYSGYPGSGGATTVANLDEDVRNAYSWLQERGRAPTFVLGFSMGSGVAGNVIASLTPAPAGLILCEAFPSLREAARCVVRPAGALAQLLPDVWKTRERLAHLAMPLLIVHTTGDALFPVAMANELHRYAPPSAELIVLEGHAHNALFATVPRDYWAVVMDFIERVAGAYAG